MDVNQINNNQQQNYLISIVNDLRNKFKILEEKQNMNEKLSIKNKDNILNLNKNIGIVYKNFLDFKNQSKINFEEKNKILNLENNNNKNEINNINNEQIENIKNKYEEINKKIDAKFEELKKEFEKLKNDINIKNKELEQLKNDVNIKNKELEQLKIDIRNKSIELKIDEKEEITVFEKFENLVGQVISKNIISSNDIMKFEEISDKLIKNDISPLEQLNKYFSQTLNFLFKKNELSDVHSEKLEKYTEIKKQIYLTVEKIENELTENYLKFKKMNKNQAKKPTNYIEKFRNDFKVQKEDATDEDIIKYISQYKTPSAAYKALMERYNK